MIQRAYEELNRFSWNDIELNTYEQELKRERDAQAILEQQRLEGRQEGMQQGIQQGMQQGIQQGRQEERKEIAKELQQQGLPLESISKAMKISVAELQSLLSEKDASH